MAERYAMTKWHVIENIATLAAVVALWYITDSAWSLLLMLNLNYPRKV
jgi:membrane-bound metal-dependent hydrolase YbcI (DUF457 family)